MQWAIGLKKEGAPDTWMNLVNIMLKYSHKVTNITRFHLCVRSPWSSEIHRPESRMVVVGLGEELVSTGDRVSVWEDEKVLDMDGCPKM